MANPRMRRLLLFTCLAFAAPACGRPAVTPTKAGFEGPSTTRKSTVAQRKKLAVTIYNQDFGLVREVRDVDLVPNGRTALELEDVAAHIQPETVYLQSLSHPDGLEVLEQNFRYDLLTPAKLLEKYVGKQIKVYRWNSVLGVEEPVAAKVLAAERGQQPVFEIGGEVTYGYPGRLAFPEVPANLVAKPTLVVMLGSAVPKQTIELTYSTWQMAWKSDYVLTVDADDSKADLTGWVTLDNRSGATFPDAELKLVAGDVHKLKPEVKSKAYKDLEKKLVVLESKPMPAFKEEGLFEYHLYTLGRPTTLLSNEKKQVTLLEADAVPVKKVLQFYGAAGYYRGKHGSIAGNQKVSVFLEFENKKDHHLGLPLPKGTVRVYKADKSGAQQFIGEDRIDHTPTDEKVRVKMGEAFDVVGDRKQMSWKPSGYCESVSDWEISLRNHKQKAETVRVVEPAGGDWEILSSSHPSTKLDAHTFLFEVSVPAKGETKVTYRVSVKWC